jgi:hypothetical protein
VNLDLQALEADRPDRISGRMSMCASKRVVLSVVFSVGVAIAANANAQDRVPRKPQPSAPPPANAQPQRTPSPPPSWYFDPYTDGSTACVNCSGY